MVEMAAGATNRTVGAQGPVRDVLRCPGLAQIRPRFFREIFRDIHHVLPFHRGNDGLHDLVLAVVSLEVAQLNIEVACLLPPDDRNDLVDGFAVLTVATGADLNLVFDTLRDGRERATETPTNTETHSGNKKLLRLSNHRSISNPISQKSGTANDP